MAALVVVRNAKSSTCSQPRLAAKPPHLGHVPVRALRAALRVGVVPDVVPGREPQLAAEDKGRARVRRPPRGAAHFLPRLAVGGAPDVAPVALLAPLRLAGRDGVVP